MSKSLNNLFEEAKSICGDDVIESLLKDSIKKSNKNELVLTIVVNAGVHPISEDILRGEVFIASKGNIDFSSKLSIENEFKSILKNVSNKLQSKNWNKVYIVPFGPAVLSMLIKNLVYKILYINSIDVIHAGSGIHYDIDIDPREVAIEEQVDNQ